MWRERKISRLRHFSPDLSSSNDAAIRCRKQSYRKAYCRKKKLPKDMLYVENQDSERHVVEKKVVEQGPILRFFNLQLQRQRCSIVG
jgi:hypothetical protein